MIKKEDVMCIEKTYLGPFWEEFLVFIKTGQRTDGLQSLRVMKKKKIVEYGEEDMVQHEYYVRSHVRHPFLVNIICGFQDYEHLFLLAEQSQNYLVDLIHSEGRFSAKVARFYMAEILVAIQHLHSRGLSYGFLSPSNTMVGDDGHIKLKYDFLNGIDIVVGGLENNIEYASIDHISYGCTGFVSDYWSLGIVLYQMLTGITPFWAPTVGKTILKIREQDLVFPKFLDQEAKDLISRLLVPSICERLGFRKGDPDVVRKHPFFEGVDWDKLVSKEVEPPFLFNTTRKDNPCRPANLQVLYTTDYLPDQKDGYGSTFRNYGSAYSSRVYARVQKYGLM